MPIRDPDAIYIRAVRSLAVDLDAGDRLAGAYDMLHDLFDLFGNLRNRFAHGSAQMIAQSRCRKFRSNVD